MALEPAAVGIADVVDDDRGRAGKGFVTLATTARTASTVSAVAQHSARGRNSLARIGRQGTLLITTALSGAERKRAQEPGFFSTRRRRASSSRSRSEAGEARARRRARSQASGDRRRGGPPGPPGKPSPRIIQEKHDPAYSAHSTHPPSSQAKSRIPTLDNINLLIHSRREDVRFGCGAPGWPTKPVCACFSSAGRSS